MLLKIVFWSEEAACGTTSNMIATASMIVARHDCRVAMLSAEKNAHDLAGNFSRPDSVMPGDNLYSGSFLCQRTKRQ